MVAVIDLLDDVHQKFTNTIVMYDKKAVMVKSVSYCPDDMKQFMLNIVGLQSRNSKSVNILDPALNFQNFNIGYSNGGTYATWWYRKPFKQWSQGLKSNQMGWRVGQPGAVTDFNFGYAKPFIAMLENSYPTIETCKKTLMDKNGTHSLAFHRDFAISYDDIHEDYLIEYHGHRIGTSLDSALKQFKIKSEARHLIEALQEARNVQP